MSAQGIKVTARYYGPTESGKGSRIVVRWQGMQRTYPFSHAARDAFTHAVGLALGIDPSHAVQVNGRGARETNHYVVECVYPHTVSQSCSDDLFIVQHGTTTGLPLCGYHYTRQPLALTVRDLIAAGVL